MLAGWNLILNLTKYMLTKNKANIWAIVMTNFVSNCRWIHNINNLLCWRLL